MRQRPRRLFAFAFALPALALAACNSPTAPLAAPITTAVVEGGAGSAAAPVSPADAGPTTDFYACATDADCVAVPKVACCPTGHLEAVNRQSADTYKASFVCDRPKQMCPHYRIVDKRVAQCSNDTHRCEMVVPAKAPCGGPGPNAHACPEGFHCKATAPAAGTCEAD